jgi:hypothetical protein
VRSALARCALASVVAYIGHLMGHDEMVLCIHGSLNIIKPSVSMFIFKQRI